MEKETTMERLPPLFVSHGAPTLALKPGEVGTALQGIAQSLPRPRAVIVVSPHWSTRQATVSAAPRMRTIHDFGPFDPRLFEMRYEPPGAPEVALDLAARVSAAGRAVRIDSERGLDHGAWVPLQLLYPRADVPAFQLSLQPHDSPLRQFELGRMLAPLADEGVLILASGSMTHNLGEFEFGARDDAPAEPYVREFADWIAGRIEAGDVEALIDYRRRAPHALRAHPTDEHLLPLFVALGAMEPGARMHHAVRSTTYGILAMDTFVLGAIPATHFQGEHHDHGHA
jgi:4,5-DOPA dioxygenase extradiol